MLWVHWPEIRSKARFCENTVNAIFSGEGKKKHGRGAAKNLKFSFVME